MSINAARVEAAETEIAVLRVRFDNLDEKMDEIKLEVKELHDCLDRNMDETKVILKELEENNKKAHSELAKKISHMEKFKWMLMGAAALVGAIGSEAIKKLLFM